MSDPPTHRRHRRRRPARRRRRGPGRRRHPRRLAPADARHRGRPGHRRRRPAAPRRQRAARSPRCSASPPTWSTSRPASEVLGLERGQFLHAGPPIEWDRASGPLRGALMGGAALEGLVDDPEDAVALFESGTSVSPRAVPPPRRGRPDGRRRHAVDVDVRARGPGDRAAYALLAQRGARQGAALRRLRPRGARPGCAGWATCSARCCRPPCAARPRPVDVTGILTQMLQMGDEAHNRNRAGTLMLLRDLAPAMVTSRRRRRPTSPRRCASSAATTTSSSTSRCPPASSRSTPPATSTGSTMVVAMARNGTDFGIQVSGTGDEWFTGPAQLADGPLPRRLRPRRRQPRHRRLGDHRDRRHRRLRDGDRPGDRAPRRRLACPTRSPPPAGCTRSPSARTRAGRCPSWSSRARPTGIDVTQVCRTGILPQINTGMAGKRRRRRPGRRRAGHPARRDLPEGAGRAGGAAVRRRRPLVVDPGRLLAGQVARSRP